MNINPKKMPDGKIVCNGDNCKRWGECDWPYNTPPPGDPCVPGLYVEIEQLKAERDAMIKYICTECSKIIHLTGFYAVNEVGRKYCDICGDNHDNLMVVSVDDLEKATNDYKTNRQPKEQGE